jgi:uncharacterized protein YndB with AHSA1/START domain
MEYSGCLIVEVRNNIHMEKIKVETTIEADIKKVWEHWNNPESIKGWAFASDTWECPYAENDLRADGRFLTRMSAKDGSFSFDFTGRYTEVIEFEKITYIMDKADGEDKHRDCTIIFTDLGNGSTKIEEEFYPEQLNSAELQRSGWQAILDNFKKFVASH